MPSALTVLPTPRPGDDPLRAFLRTERAWAGRLGDVEQLDCGLAVHAPELSRVRDGNAVFAAALPPGTSPADAVAEVDGFFAARRLSCLRWSFDPTAPADRVTPLIEHLRSADLRSADLRSAGWAEGTDEVMALAAPPRGAAPADPPIPGLMVLPTRSAPRQAREMAEATAAAWGEPQLVAAALASLDDPHADGLIALVDGRAAGWATVLAAGDAGLIEQVRVADAFRRRGVGRFLVARAMEICARSLFRQVVLVTDPGNVAAKALYGAFGFRTVATVPVFRRVV